MIEILFLCLAGAALARLAKLRGGRGWPWVVVMVLGYVVLSVATTLVLGSGPGLLAGVVWVGLLFPILFLVVGKGRRLRSSWQCPSCQFFNDPTTLVCPCGYKLDTETG